MYTRVQRRGWGTLFRCRGNVACRLPALDARVDKNGLLLYNALNPIHSAVEFR